MTKDQRLSNRVASLAADIRTLHSQTVYAASTLDLAARALRDHSGAPSSAEWIPVEEALPPPLDSVLALFAKKSGKGVTDDCMRIGYICHHTGRWIITGGLKREILAWMPLPAPPTWAMEKTR